MDNETPWTPGPWAALDDGYQHRIVAGGVELAGCNTAGDVSDAVNAANARLIAAAPEMAALLERLAGSLHENMADARGYLCADIRALLAKISKGA